MNYSEYLMMNNSNQQLENAQTCTFTDATRTSKDLLGENEPYYTIKKIDGSQYIFNQHFINTFINALSFGCCSKMNVDEQSLLDAYIAFCDKRLDDEDLLNDPNYKLLKTLDEWIVNEIYCTNLNDDLQLLCEKKTPEYKQASCQA